MAPSDISNFSSVMRQMERQDKYHGHKSLLLFTGHRPEKLHIPESVVLQELNIAITAALQDGHTTFISGMAKGVDIWAAELILERRRASPEINLICSYTL